MKRTLLAALLAIAVSAVSPAIASITYNDTITYINGSGNPNTGWTSDTEANGILLGLRADNRTTGATPNDGAGTYTFGSGNTPSGKAIWNYQFTINSDINGVNKLNTYFYWISMVGGNVIQPSIVLGPVNALVNAAWFDNAYGNNATPNGGGTVATNATHAATLAAANNVSANSESITFLAGAFPSLASNPMGNYVFDLYATSVNDPNASKLADVSIDVRVVPEPKTILAGILLLLPFAFSVIRIFRKRVALAHLLVRS